MTNMNQRLKKSVALLLTLALILGSMGFTAYAESEEIIDPQQMDLGHVTFSLETKTLDGKYISGTNTEIKEISIPIPIDADTKGGYVTLTEMLEKVCVDNEISTALDENGLFIINNIAPVGYESGWMVSINNDVTGVLPTSLKDGDLVRWHYSVKGSGQDVLLLDKNQELQKLVLKGESIITANESSYTETQKEILQLSINEAGSYINNVTSLSSQGSDNKSYITNINIEDELKTVGKLISQLYCAINKTSYIPVTSITIETPHTTYLNEPTQLSLKFEPKDATDKTVVWNYVDWQKGNITQDGILTLNTTSSGVLISLKHNDLENNPNIIVTAVEKPNLPQVISKSAMWLANNTTPYNLNINAFALNQSGHPNHNFNLSIYQSISKMSSLEMSSKYPSDVAYMLFALASAGFDTKQIGNYNLEEILLSKLAISLPTFSGDKLAQQYDTLKIVFPLLAIENFHLEIPKNLGYSKDQLIWYLAKHLTTKSYYADSIDTEGMILTALAPYRGKSVTYNGETILVDHAIADAVAYFHSIQLNTGGFASPWGESPDANIWITLALATCGIDVKTEFVKSGKTPIDAVLSSYDVETGSIYSNGWPNEYSTQQVLFGLEGYRRTIANEKAIYDVYDLIDTAIATQEERDNLASMLTDANTAYSITSYSIFSRANLKQIIDEVINSNILSNDKPKKSLVITYTSALNKAIAGLSKQVNLQDGTATISNPTDTPSEITISTGVNTAVTYPEGQSQPINLNLSSADNSPQISITKGNLALKIDANTQITFGPKFFEVLKTEETNKVTYKNSLQDLLGPSESLANINHVITFSDAPIKFNQYVTIVLPYISDQVAYLNNVGKSTKIHYFENQPVSSDVTDLNEYAYKDGNNLIIKTNHFTTFVTYSVKDASQGGSTSEENEAKVIIDLGKNGGVYRQTTVNVGNGATPYNLLVAAIGAENIQTSGQGRTLYVEGIKCNNKWYQEFSSGEQSGWMYSIDGDFIQKPANSITVNANQTLRWVYTVELGNDVGGGVNQVPVIENGSTTIDATVNKDGVANATITKTDLEDALKKKSALKIQSKVGNITLDIDTISTLLKNSSDIKVSLAPVDTKVLNETAKIQIGTRPIIEFTIMQGSKEITTFAGKVTISIPYTPTAEEDQNALLAYYINEQGQLKLMQNATYDLKLKAITFKTNHFSKYAIGYHNVHFNDVTNHWAKPAISYLASRDIIKGKSEGQFKPNENISRAEFVTILANKSAADLSKYSQSKFMDVNSNAWYKGAVTWAASEGIVTGIKNDDGTIRFNPNANISREDMAVILDRFMKKIEKVTLPSPNKAVVFSDDIKIDSYAKESVVTMQKSGVINGITNVDQTTSFAPKKNATRAEAAKMISTLIQITN